MLDCVLTQHFKINARNYFHLLILRNTRMHVWKKNICLCPERDLQFFLVWSKQWSSYLKSDRTPWMSVLWNIGDRITRGSSCLNRKKKNFDETEIVLGQGFNKMITWQHHIDLSATHPRWESPVLLHSEVALLDWDVVTVKAIWVHGTHRHI